MTLVVASGVQAATISFVLPSTTENTPFLEIFRRFEEKTGHRVELQPLPGGAEYDNMIKIRFSTADFPDVLLMQPGTKQYVKLRAEETLYEWSGEREVLDRIEEQILSFQVLNGKVYGIPWGSTGMMGIFYNKDVFEAVGVSPPQSYAELVEIAHKVKAAGYIPFYEAVRDGWPVQIFYLTGWVTHVDPAIGPEGVAALDRNALRLSEIPELRDLFERHLALKDAGLMQPDLLAGTYDEMQDLFGEGKVAMVFMLDGFLPLLRAKFGDAFVREKVGFFPFPADDGVGTAMITQPDQLMVPKNARNREAAIELVKFMTSPEAVQIWYEMRPGIPIYKGATANLYPVQQTVRQFIAEGRATVNIQNRLTPTFVDFAKTLQNLFIYGDIDQAIQEFDANYRRDGASKLLEGF